MEVLKNNDWSRINEAYQVFINTGRILPNTVRIEIENSWKRSRSINPWTPRPEPLDDEEFNAVLRENAELVRFAEPVMQYVYATNGHLYEDNLVHLMEKTGVVIALCTRVCSYPIPLKKRICEATIGTSTSSTVLVEQKPLEMGGTEFYKACYQTCFGGAAPIRDRNGNLIGVISLYNNYGKIPEQPLELVETAAHLIEDLLKNPASARKKSVVYHQLFTRMIDYANYHVLVVDSKGKIANCNNSFKELLGLLDGEDIVGKHCHQFGIKLEEIISDGTYGNKDVFKIETAGLKYNCFLQNNKTVKWLNNQEHTILLFSIVDSPLKRAKLINLKKNIDTFERIVGRSAEHTKLINTARRAAKVPTSVLIDGESGTGKEVFARAIHNASARASKPFIAINCGSIPREILQSELFGYEEGAFTGGKKGGQVGKFEAADGGTILLDEIGEMPLEMQISLLRFLQDKTVTRVGGRQAKAVDVRIIAATNRDLQQLVADGLFRRDLYYRLNVIRITLPPLSNRKEDILPIAEYYVDFYSQLYGLEKMTITQETRNLLYQYNWPGNIRELANVIEKAVVYSDSSQITPDLLPGEILEYQPGLTKISPEGLEQREKQTIARALNAAKGNVSEAAKSIGISRNTLYRKIDKYGLHCQKYWGGESN